MYLNDIIDYKKLEILEFKKNHQSKEFEKQITNDREGIFFKELMKDQKVNIIAEVKKASPSMGVISEEFDYIQIAKDYTLGGAAAISILTDQKFFKGDIQYLKDIREATDLPLLRKDFIIDEIQILEACANGADACLLIVKAFSDPKRLSQLIQFCKDVYLSPLVEVHSQDEIELALDCGAKIIGINNRNLENFKISVQTSHDLLPLIPKDCLKISESGISDANQIKLLRKSGANAFLIGTSLMKSNNKQDMFKELLSAY